MRPEQGPSEEEMGISKEKESSELSVGQRVSFVEGESLMGEGNPVTKFGTIEDIKRDTVGVKIEGDVQTIVRVAKEDVQDASEN